MRIAAIIKRCSQPNEDIYYCAYGEREAILYRQCVLYLMPKGTAAKIRDKTAGKITRKILSSVKKELEVIDRHTREDYMERANVTDTTDIIGKKRIEVIKLESEKREKWVNKEYLESFGTTCEFYFAEDGWCPNQVYVTEKGVFVGMIMRVAK